MPSTVAVGRAHNVSAIPSPITSTPSSTPASVRNCSGGYAAPGHFSVASSPRTVVALVVPQRREHADECRERIGGGAAEHSRVHGTLKRAHGDHDPRDPAQACGQGRHAHRDVARVTDEDRVGSEQVGVSGTNSSPRSCSSEPSPTIFTVTGGSFPSARRAVRCAARPFAVGGAAAVPAAAALGQLPGRRLPAFGGRGLHVVVEVEEDRRRPRRTRDLARDGLAPSAVSWARTSWTPTPEKASTVHSAIRSHSSGSLPSATDLNETARERSSHACGIRLLTCSRRASEDTEVLPR